MGTTIRLDKLYTTGGVNKLCLNIGQIMLDLTTRQIVKVYVPEISRAQMENCGYAQVGDWNELRRCAQLDGRTSHTLLGKCAQVEYWTNCALLEKWSSVRYCERL
jgi:hypothetical protein